MIVSVDRDNLMQAAAVHAASWKESHRAVCAHAFVEAHTPERQAAYMLEKMRGGSRFFMLVANGPVGVVSVTGDVIGDLYVLPEQQGKGFGTELLSFAAAACGGTPTLWILETNAKAERFYRKAGFQRTGTVYAEEGRIAEIELSGPVRS